MKNRYLSLTGLILIFAVLTLSAGCGVRINGKEYEFYRSARSEKNNNIFNAIGGENSGKQELSQDNPQGGQLKVSTGAGNIRIEKTNSAKVDIKADKKVRGASDESKKTILDNMVVSIEKDGDILEVAVKTKSGEDFWDWQKSNYKAYQITMNLSLEVPESIKTINANTGAGNINIKDMTAELELSTGAGNIEIDDTSAVGDCKLSTGAGNIDFDGRIDDISSFDISTGVGNVTFEVPEETGMHLDAETGVGNMSGSFIKTDSKIKTHFTGDVNGGGPDVKLNTGVGNVKAGGN